MVLPLGKPLSQYPDGDGRWENLMAGLLLSILVQSSYAIANIPRCSEITSLFSLVK
jgi:hypothetical protein